ncbi:MAG: chemotaxis protein CheA [Desulfuromonadaceae bacterium]|nr:chemotaxis protein CheA [Desulfuromonadaceae bacterium]
MDNDFDMSVLLNEYLEDAAGHLEAIEAALLELEKRAAQGEYDKAIITLLLGNLHTLKGNSGLMGFTSLQQYLHKLEAIFKPVMDGSSPLSAGLFETFYAALNAIRDGLRNLSENPAATLDFNDEIMAVECFRTPIIDEKRSSAFSENVPLPKDKKDDFSYITQQSNTLKVNFEKLDELLNLVGELVIHRTTLSTLESRLREKVDDRAILEAFSESCQLIGKSANELRESIMKVRMLPIKVVFQRFNRLVRDLSRQHGKEVNLVFEGDETELDKRVIDKIGEPLLHLIRNAIDHGFETPAERERLGKPRVGTLVLKASHENGNIIISAEDDGGGMSADRIRKKALESGFLDENEAQSQSTQETLNLVFTPGFSTSSEVSETSGRGIGLDVVKKTITSFNGMIDIDSTPGKGTRFTIKLPLTLAIIQALMVEVSGEIFAIPLSGVLESIKVNSDEIHEVSAREMILLRDGLLPICRLERFFGMTPQKIRKKEYVVVVENGEKRGGLVVDRLVGQQEIVIKAHDDYLGELPGIAGGTVLGNGRISHILDIASLIGNGR